MLERDEIEGLGVALNEASLLGAEVDPGRRLAAITLSVLTLPAEGPPPPDARLQILLDGVTRVAASLRLGSWNEETAPVQPFSLHELLAVVESFGGRAIYGWEFFDRGEEQFESWFGKYSLDERFSDEPPSHSISLFQEGDGDRHLDLCIWFQEIRFQLPDGQSIAAADVIAGGRRWWDAFYRNDPRTTYRGLIPLKS